MELLPGSGIKRSCIRFKQCNKCFSLLMPDCSQPQLKSPMDSCTRRGQRASGRELGDGGRVRACTRVLLLGWKLFLRRSLAQKNNPGEEFQSQLRRRVVTSQEKSGHVLGVGQSLEKHPCAGSRMAVSQEKGAQTCPSPLGTS